MSVLVTGGAGYIGSFTVEALRRRGERIVVLDNLVAGHRAALPPGVLLVQGDTADAGLVRRLVIEHGVNQVVHFAAFTSVPDSVANPERYFRNNLVNAVALLDVIVELGIQQFVFSSTAAVFGEPEAVPIAEDHPTRPTSPYGLSKLMVEQVLDAYEVAHGLRHVALRYFNACGGSPERGEDHAPETHLIPLVLQVALGRRDAIQLFGDDYPTPDGSCIRDYIHVEDLARAHLLALDHLARGGPSLKVNLGNGRGYSVREVIEVARQVTGHAIPVKLAPRRAGDPSALVAASGRAREALGWEPQIPGLRAIVESAWQWHSTHPNGYGDRA